MVPAKYFLSFLARTVKMIGATTVALPLVISIIAITTAAINTDALTVRITPSCAPDCRAAILAALAECKAAQAAAATTTTTTTTITTTTTPCTVSFEPGVYPVGSPNYQIPLTVTGFSNLSIEGNGAEIVLLNLSAAFLFQGVSGLRISGLSFEMQRLPYTLATVTSVSSSKTSFNLSFDASVYPFPSKGECVIVCFCFVLFCLLCVL